MPETPAERVEIAYQAFRGDMIHAIRCGPKNVGMRQERADDDRCDCGLRDLYLALEELVDE